MPIVRYPIAPDAMAHNPIPRNPIVRYSVVHNPIAHNPLVRNVPRWWVRRREFLEGLEGAFAGTRVGSRLHSTLAKNVQNPQGPALNLTLSGFAPASGMVPPPAGRARPHVL